MLIKRECKVNTSFKFNFVFDGSIDGEENNKEVIIELGDLITISFYSPDPNSKQLTVTGIIKELNAVGGKPNYIIVDSSREYESFVNKIFIDKILDIDIL